MVDWVADALARHGAAANDIDVVMDGGAYLTLSRKHE